MFLLNKKIVSSLLFLNNVGNICACQIGPLRTLVKIMIEEKLHENVQTMKKDEKNVDNDVNK